MRSAGASALHRLRRSDYTRASTGSDAKDGKPDCERRFRGRGRPTAGAPHERQRDERLNDAQHRPQRHIHRLQGLARIHARSAELAVLVAEVRRVEKVRARAGHPHLDGRAAGTHDPASVRRHRELRHQHHDHSE